MKKIGFFEEDEGIKSSGRLNSFLSLVAGIGISVFSIATKQLDANVIALVVLFVVAAFAPHAVVKFAERDK